MSLDHEPSFVLRKIGLGLAIVRAGLGLLLIAAGIAGASLLVGHLL